MTGPEDKKDWIVIKSYSEDGIKNSLLYLQEIWSTKMWILQKEHQWYLWANCSPAVLGDIKCKALAFIRGWNDAQLN